MAGHVRQIAAVVLGAALLSTGAVACGGESAAAQAEQLILGAAEATFEAGTAQVLIELEGLGDGVGQVDFEARQSETTVDLPGGPTSVFLDGDELFVGVDDVVGEVDDDLTRLQAILILLSPIPAVQLLNGLVGDVDIVGDDTIDGIDATHYSIRVDAQDVLDSLDGADRRVMQLVLDALGVDILDLDVWLDDEGRVVQLQAVIDLDSGRSVRVTLGLRDFGSDVRIRIPDPGRVLEAEEFALATADLSGTWTGTTTTVSATDTVQWPVNDPIEIELDMTCAPDGSCVNEVSGNTWEASGAGEFTIVATEELTCVDTVTQEPGAPGGFVEEYESTWVVTAQEDGVATAMTATGTVTGRVTPIGQAESCTLPQGGLRGSAQRESVATRTG